MKNRNPCEICQNCLSKDLGCAQWKRWFMESWGTSIGIIRAYLWRQRDDLGKQKHPRCFYYSLPHEQEDPCLKCNCAVWCDTPCSLRLHWWDVTMERLRKTLLENPDQKNTDDTN